jgi:hypothetical protein
MANVFANSANLLLTALFFHPLLPLSIPIAFAGFFCSYWVNKYVFLRRIKRPEEMSGMMATFFANLLPEIALIWALSLALFYRRLYLDLFEGTQGRILPAWVMFGIACFFILLPVRTCINRCFNEGAQAAKSYSEGYLRFSSDYDRENPVTKKEGVIRLIEKQLEGESDEEKKKELVKNKEMMQKSNMAMAFSQYSNQKMATYQTMTQMAAPRFMQVAMPVAYYGAGSAYGGGYVAGYAYANPYQTYQAYAPRAAYVYPQQQQQQQ